jgi:hypothetical protein
LKAGHKWRNATKFIGFGRCDRAFREKFSLLVDRLESLRYCFALTLFALFVQRCCAQKFSRAT